MKLEAAIVARDAVTMRIVAIRPGTRLYRHRRVLVEMQIANEPPQLHWLKEGGVWRGTLRAEIESG